MRTDRQVKHQPKNNDGFQQTVQTPMSLGLPLTIHSRVRDKNLVNNLSQVYIESDYHKILDLEKHVEQGVLPRMKETGGFCLADFVKKGVNIWFAIDNINLLEDTPTGQNKFYGTVIVIKQREEDGESVKQPLVIPQKLQDTSPSWAGTKSLLLSQSPRNHRQTNSEVVAPLFKTSPTDPATLYTVLMLTQGISAFVVGPKRKTLITLDFDLYNHALHIQQSVGNTNWILRAGVLHIAFAALRALGKIVDMSGIDTCAIETVIYISVVLCGIYGGKAHKRGIEYHITTSLAIMMMMFDSFLSEHESLDLSVTSVLL